MLFKTHIAFKKCADKSAPAQGCCHQETSEHEEPVGVVAPMNSDDLEARVKNIDERTQRIEQILPTLATKDELTVLATREDVRAEGQRTRQHFDIVAEQLKAEIALIAEGPRRRRRMSTPK